MVSTFLWKLRNKVWWLLQPLMWWIYQKVQHCDSPEYYKVHPKLVRWTGGLREFTWTWVCGHNFSFSFHIANIYWKIGKRKVL